MSAKGRDGRGWQALYDEPRGPLAFRSTWDRLAAMWWECYVDDGDDVVIEMEVRRKGKRVYHVDECNSI